MLLKKGTFKRNAIYTFSSNVLITVFNFAFYPFLTKYYSPNAFAEYAICMLILNNLNIVNTLGYPEALIVSKTKKKFLVLASSIFLISLAISLLAFIIFYFAQSIFWSQFNQSPFSWIIIVFPLSLIMALNSIVSMGTVRFGVLEKNAKVSTVIKLISKLLVLAVGLLGLANGLGLLIGDIVFFLAIVLLVLPKTLLVLLYREIFRFDINAKIHALKQYFDYPKFVFPTIWMAILPAQIPLWLIGSYYTVESIGLYSFCVGVLGVPVGVLVKSMRPVLFHKNLQLVTEEKAMQVKKIKKLVNGLIFSYGTYLVLGYWGIDLFYENLFSEKWNDGKELMKAILIGSGSIVLGSPLSSIFKVKNKIKTDLFIRLVIVAMLFPLSLAILESGFDFNSYSLLFNLAYALGFVMLLLFQLKEYHFSHSELMTTLVRIVLVLSMCYCCTYLLKSQF